MFERAKFGCATCRLRSGERLALRCKRTGRRRLRLLVSENTLELELVGVNVQLLTDWCELLRLLE